MNRPAVPGLFSTDHPSTRRRWRLPATAIVVFGVLVAGCAPAAQRPRTGPDSAAVADTLRAEKVRRQLLAKLGGDALGIEIAAEGHRVDLAGEVDRRSTQELAEEVAKSVRGVRRVRNRIALAEPGPGTPLARGVGEAEREVLDATLESRVKAALLGELGRRALDIEVEASDGVVSLRGWVPDRERKRLALATAEALSGVEEVVDLIRVGLES